MSLDTMRSNAPQVWTEAEREPSAFGVRVIEAGRMVLARVIGPLDAEGINEFLERVRPYSNASRRVVVDLRRADFVDSAGIRGLLQLHTKLEAQKGQMRLVVRPASRVERTLQLLQLQNHFHIYGTVLAAWVRRPEATTEAPAREA